MNNTPQKSTQLEHNDAHISIYQYKKIYAHMQMGRPQFEVITKLIFLNSCT